MDEAGNLISTNFKYWIFQFFEVNNNFKSFPGFCMIVCVICKWSHPPSLLSLVLNIMIMGFRDREVIAAVNPRCYQNRNINVTEPLQLQRHPTLYPIWEFLEYKKNSKIKQSIFEYMRKIGINWKMPIILSVSLILIALTL